jgi:hypothetical protein
MTDDEIVEAMARAIHETGPFRDAPWASVAGPHRSECLAFARAALAVARPMIEGPLIHDIERHVAIAGECETRADRFEEALRVCDRVLHFDLRRMIEWGDDFNQAVKDAADAARSVLSRLKEPT